MPNGRVSRRTFVTRAAGVAALAPMAARSLASQPPPSSAPLLLYVGTYSSGPAGNGRGIHVFRVDPTTGALTPAAVTEHVTSPSALVFDTAGARCYTANATDLVDDDTSGSVSAFGVDRASGRLRLLNTVPSGGLGPTYVSIHPTGRHLLVANYAGGSVAVFPILADGRLAPASDVKKTDGTVGPRRATNAPPGSFAISGHDAPHPHMIRADRAGRFVIAPDLGLDRIFVWRFDAQAGVLTPADTPSVALPPGDGPRHFAFHPNGRWLYSIQEEASTVALFDYDDTTGGLTPRQMLSSLPAGHAGSSFASGILVSRDGRFVYAGNRLHDSVAIFATGADGTLTLVGEEWTRGSYPRSFNIDPTGTFLYVCNQRADNVTSFRIDTTTGRLVFTGQYTPVGSPSDIAFLG